MKATDPKCGDAKKNYDAVLRGMAELNKGNLKRGKAIMSRVVKRIDGLVPADRMTRLNQDALVIALGSLAALEATRKSAARRDGRGLERVREQLRGAAVVLFDIIAILDILALLLERAGSVRAIVA
jgi:hypothetical protein